MADTKKCDQKYFDNITKKQGEVYGWLDKAKKMKSYDQKVDCIDNMNKVLAEVWDDYNAAKAGCAESDDDGRRRLLFGSFFKGVRDFFIDVGKKVAEFVVDFVENAKCALVGAGFKLFGFATDIALTIVTGGATKLSKAACVGARAATKNRRLLTKTAEGVSDAVCAVNKKIESDVLEEVCDFTGDIDAPSNRRVKRFVGTFQNAVCGQPGKALAKILEDVVDCEIGCASGKNLFCGD